MQGRIQKTPVHSRTGEKPAAPAPPLQEARQPGLITPPNQALQRLLRSGAIQAKEAPGRMPLPTSETEARIQSLRGGGRPLAGSERSFFEPRFGRDFSGVRIHSDLRAQETARAVQARAFTLGQDIVFAAGQYAPQSAEGRRLLAHELTHTLQQSGAPVSDRLQRAEPEERQSDVWGGFRISGDPAFVRIVRDDLNRLNATRQGAGVLAEVSRNRYERFYRSLIDIRPAGECGFRDDGAAIYYSRNGCRVNPCKNEGTSRWRSVPSYVWLFHEIVHAYLYYLGGRKVSDPDFECRTVGLGDFFRTVPYSENRLRCEMGYPVRPCYGDVCTGLEPPSCPSTDRESAKTRP